MLTLFLHQSPEVYLISHWWAGPPSEGGRGATCPGPQTSKGPQLKKYPKIEQGPIKIGASTRPHQNRGEYKALAATLKDIKGLVYRYSQRFGVLSTGF